MRRLVLLSAIVTLGMLAVRADLIAAGAPRLRAGADTDVLIAGSWKAMGRGIMATQRKMRV